MISSDIWHKYHSWYFKIVSNFTRLSAREITYNNFEISLVVFTPNITANHAITYTNFQNVRICLTFDFYEGKRLFLSVTSEFEGIDGLTSLMGTVWVKVLFFLYFRLFISYGMSNQDFIRSKSDSISLITWFKAFLRIFGWYFECF